MSCLWSIIVIITYLHPIVGEERLIKLCTSDCVCPGDIVMYECTVFGGIGATTIWKSDFFQCSSGKKLIELVHRPLTEGEEYHTRICNNGNIAGRIVKVENNSYTSQLNITLTYDIAGESIECIGDNGTNTYGVGLLNITEISEFHNISWTTSICPQSTIHFNWSAFSHGYHDHIISYNILASNCGTCPNTTNTTTATCTDLPNDGRLCEFSVQSEVCGSKWQNATVTVTMIPVCPGENDPQIIILVAISSLIMIVALLVLSSSCIFKKWSSIESCSCQKAYMHSHEEQVNEIFSGNSQAEDDMKVMKIFDNELNGMYNLKELDITHRKIQEPMQERSVPILNQLTLNNLLIKLQGQVASHWYKFGLAIGIPDDIMKQLKDYSDKDALVEILDYWLKNHHSGRPTWQDVATALEEAGFNMI